MADTAEIGEDDPFIRAGEYALGVLEGAELSARRRSLLSDRGFAEAVEWWEYRLGSMSEAAGEFMPSPSVWAGVLSRIDAQDTSHDPAPAVIESRKASRWSIAALLAGAAMGIAGLAFFVATPRTTAPPPVAATSGPQLIVQLEDEEGARKLAGVIDVENDRLALSISGLEPEVGKAPELWVIPAGGAPVSLGAIPRSGSFSRTLTEEEADLLVAGATLAVTFEDETGRRHETPTMPIVLAGPLDRV